jgi:hypothetical protein
MAITGTFVIIVLLILAGAKIFFDMRKTQKKLSAKNQDASMLDAVKANMKSFFVSQDRYPKDLSVLSDKSVGGQPYFYNEVDHTRGRFIRLYRTPEDLADERVLATNSYRARVLIDSKIFWFIPRSHPETTVCRFRKGIDIVTINPGEEVGVPPEGLVIFKRSMDGTRISQGAGERWRSQLLEEKYTKSILVDHITNLRDKERFTAYGDTSKEYTDQMENKLKRTKKLHDVSAGRNTGMEGYGSPYTQEMYGEESPGLAAGGSENLWNFQG